MKKWSFFLLLFLILFCGCSKTQNQLIIEGIIEKNDNALISIHYPKTGIKKLDSELEKVIMGVRKDFEESISDTITLKEIAELNIDYKYKLVGNRYINVVLSCFYTAPSLTHPINEVKTFVYDTKENQFLSLNDIANINGATIKMNLLKKYSACILPNHLDQVFNDSNNILFTFSSNSITLYFNPYVITSGNCGIIKYEIPYQDFKISIEKDVIKDTVKYHPSSKELSISKPTIALTFDDGPSKYTKEIVSLLNEYESNATFFILGNKVENYHDTLTFVLESGNELGNHSYNHKRLTKLSPLELHSQIDMTNKIVKDTLDYDIRLLRPTYGSISETLRKDIDMEVVLWNVDTLDWKLRNGKKVASKALNDIEDGKIVLMHDIYGSTLDALKIMLPELKKRGYQIVTVSELKEIKNKRNEEGR